MRVSNSTCLAIAAALAIVSFARQASAQPVDAGEEGSKKMRLVALPVGLKAEIPVPHTLDRPSLSFGEAMKIASASGEVGEFELTLSAMKAKKDRRAGGLDWPSSYRPMFGASGELSIDLGASDELAIVGQWTRKKFKPVQILPGRRFLASEEQIAGLRWTNEARYETQLSWYRIGPAGRRSDLERMIELSSGAPRSGEGWAITFVAHTPGRRDLFRYGVDMRQQATLDKKGLGPQIHSNEVIGTAFIRMLF